MGSSLGSKSMLVKLGKSPSSLELANAVAVQANEYMNGHLFSAMPANDVSASSDVDMRRWEHIPQYAKRDLLIGKYLGKGSFADVFEVRVVVMAVEDNGLDSPKCAELDRLIEVKRAAKIITKEEEEEIDNDLAAQIDTVSREANNKNIIDQEENNQTKAQGYPEVSGKELSSSSTGLSKVNVRRSFIFIREPALSKESQVTYAMKCLRPQIRSNAEKRIIGVEDLVHETAMLAGLDHPHIIKVHGCAITIGAADKEKLSDYFILIDCLQDTLEERIASWSKTATAGRLASKRSKAMSLSRRLKIACSIADALSYLFSRGVILRDLKPANIGFDAQGVLKLFDFGLSISVNTANNNAGLVHGICGTRRYMAPENGLGLAYSFPVDVYSFGILLWEMCSLKTPFAHIKSLKEFHSSVFHKGDRPKLEKFWPCALKEIIGECWCSESGKRPKIDAVSASLKAHIRDVQENDNTGSLRKSSLFRRLRG